MFSLVTGNTFFPDLIKDLKYGTTDPLELNTFPYLTIENRKLLLPTRLFAATNNLSEASFVAP